MKTTDASGVYRTSSEALPATADEREAVGRRSVQQIERRKERYRHFSKHDPGGVWVAVDGERVVGVALALEREGVDTFPLRGRRGVPGRGLGPEAP